MKTHDLGLLADAIQRIAQSAAPLGRYMESVHADTETILQERNHWIAEQKRKRNALDSVQKRREEDLAPLRAKLASLNNLLQEKRNESQRLELAVRKNQEVIKKHLRQ